MAAEAVDPGPAVAAQSLVVRQRDGYDRFPGDVSRPDSICRRVSTCVRHHEYKLSREAPWAALSIDLRRCLKRWAVTVWQRRTFMDTVPARSPAFWLLGQAVLEELLGRRVAAAWQTRGQILKEGSERLPHA